MGGSKSAIAAFNNEEQAAEYVGKTKDKTTLWIHWISLQTASSVLCGFTPCTKPAKTTGLRSQGVILIAMMPKNRAATGLTWLAYRITKLIFTLLLVTIGLSVYRWTQRSNFEWG